MTQLQVEYHEIDSLAKTLGCTCEEATAILISGTITCCNFGAFGTPSYLRRDLDRVAEEIREAREAGRQIATWETAKSVRSKPPGQIRDPHEIEMIPRADGDNEGFEHDEDGEDDEIAA